MLDPRQGYRLQVISLEEMDPAARGEWNGLLERCPSSSPVHYPGWLAESFSEQKQNLTIYFLYRGDALAGIAPVLLKDWPIRWQLGESTMARWPLKRLCLLGGGPHFPEDPKAYDLLFHVLMAREFDAMYLEGTALESFVWKFIEQSDVVRRVFSKYAPETPSPRVMLRLEGNFENYMGRFSSKHRQTLRRKVRKVQDVGDVHMMRCMGPSQVDAFCDQAVEISRKTYQWNLLGEGLSNIAKVRQRLRTLAQYGWLRSYLLTLKGKPCAFLTGYQFGDRFYLDDMGYDPDWREYSVGTVLQLMLIEDLFEHDRPELYDLGEYGPHKEEFATDNCLEGKLLLFRRRPYTALVFGGHQVCEASTKLASVLLERLGLKKKLKKLIRRWSTK